MPYLRGPHMQGLTINARVFLFTGALSALTGVIFGLAPAWQASKLDLQASLSQGTASVGPVRQRLRSALAVSEIALALVLLVGAGLMIKSTLRLLEVKMGFNPERLITMQSELPSARYSDDDRARAFHQQLLARVGSIPGVVGAATVNWLPMLPGPADLVTVEGQAPPPPGTEPKSNTRAVSSSYFSTMGITLLKGRVFTERDDASAPGVVIVNHTLAARLFGKEEALGRRIGFGAKPFEIIGVVDDERVGALDEESAPVAYRPYLQEPWTRLALVARTNAEPQTVIDAVRNETRALDPTLAFYAAMTMERLIADTPSTFLRRYPAIILACFAAIALILAAIGIYGVIAYSVSQRTREIGLRMALGARRGDVLRLVFRQGASITLAGVCVGLAGSFALTRLMQGMLFGVTATDPLTFTGVALSLAVVALLACWVPARRATRIDPMIALRCDG
jgi:putative ABC transport system permease protein